MKSLEAFLVEASRNCKHTNIHSGCNHIAATERTLCIGCAKLACAAYIRHSELEQLKEMKKELYGTFGEDD